MLYIHWFPIFLTHTHTHVASLTHTHTHSFNEQLVLLKKTLYHTQAHQVINLGLTDIWRESKHTNTRAGHDLPHIDITTTAGAMATADLVTLVIKLYVNITSRRQVSPDIKRTELCTAEQFHQPQVPFTTSALKWKFCSFHHLFMHQ